MDDHLRIIERNGALTDHTASVNADGWRHDPAPRRALRSSLAAALIALAVRLDPARIPARREGTTLTPIIPA